MNAVAERLSPPETIPGGSSRSLLARARAALALESLASCQMCAHRCGANRLLGAAGRCHAGAAARIFSAQIEVSDELELVPVYSIALSGCDLRCDFCITGAESWNANAGSFVSAAAVAQAAVAALGAGAQSIMLLGGEPTIHLPTALSIVAALPDRAKLVWKTNAHGTAESRCLLDGLFDIWVADYKFGNDQCALRLSHTPDYTRVVRENLRWAAARTELLVRHLLMPGHLECCWLPVARWLATELPAV
jgi:putative pyruvate formate lyase activating enzyme